MKKPIIFSFFALAFSSFQLFAQSSYEMYENIEGTPVRVLNGGVLHKSMKMTNNDYSFPLLVKNVSSVNCTTWAKKVYLSIVPGTQNWFCWEGCYFPNTMVSKVPYIIGPNQTYNGFDGPYKAAGQIGDSRIRYVFFNGTNLNDTTYFEVIYTSTATGVEENRPNAITFEVFPNPVKTTLHCSYNMLTGRQGTILLKNILGEELVKLALSEQEGEIAMDITGYPNGIYFCVLVIDDQVKTLQKIIIQN
ncbi:MAG: T9SS type A sorting domain-containing protein [Bacteroidales bacterium]|jgi:hypothetical protein|nr:T9SS type A sorting domain-containing protein [Bacteroidales bacterium]